MSEQKKLKGLETLNNDTTTVFASCSLFLACHWAISRERERLAATVFCFYGGFMFTFGSLFAGIGGFDLGLERAGMTCKWQVEIDPFCLKVLSKHWPSVLKFEDVRNVGSDNLESVDLICGGFPCQDISNAGKREGIKGKKSGLWAEYRRIICEIRPRYVLVENVAALLTRGLETVLGDLAASGYDAEWQCLPAAAFGAPHRRDRLFIIAHSIDNRRNNEQILAGKLQAQKQSQSLWQSFGTVDNKIWLEDYCGLSRNVDGIPHRVDRLKSLGNAIVPQIPEWIGRQIMKVEAAQ